MPRRRARWPWLLSLLAVLAVGVGGAVVYGQRAGRIVLSDKVKAAAAPPERPPVQVVEGLPQLRQALDAQPFMGGVLVARGDRVLFRQVFGQSEGRPLGLDSRFRLASVSKQFTAAAILRLQDEGRLSVEDPLCRFIEGCPAAWAPIRLSHLLSHTSGVPDLMAQAGWGLRRVTPTTPAELTANSARYGLQFEPGTRVRYNNAGYNLLGVVVEKVSGQPLGAYLDQAFFGPLGMADTGFDDGRADQDIIMGYASFPAGLTAQPKVNPSVIFAAGALYSTLDDMLVWTRALHGGRVLSERSYAQMIANHAPPPQTPAELARPRRDWGFGVFVGRLGERTDKPFSDRQIYHTGSWSGFRNLVSWQPEAEVTTIVLSNNYHQGDRVFLISQQALAEALGLPTPTLGDRRGRTYGREPDPAGGVEGR